MKDFFYHNFNRSKQFFNSSNKTPFILIVTIIFLIGLFGLQRIFGQSNTNSSIAQSDEKVTVSGPIQKQTINKSFSFPIRDEQGKEVSKIIYAIESVELRDEIIVKGQKATAIKGRQFFIVNIKLTNNFDKTINVNAKDYLRFIINGSSEKLAPDMHSDPVEVQPISTKFTRLGSTISEADKKITLQVGEITGKKENIQVNLK